MGAIKINQLLLHWLMRVALPIASLKLQSHNSFGEQRSKIKMTVERERKGRGKEGKMSFQMRSENRWGVTEAQRFIVLAEIALNGLLKAAHLILSHRSTGDFPRKSTSSFLPYSQLTAFCSNFHK